MIHFVLANALWGMFCAPSMGQYEQFDLRAQFRAALLGVLPIAALYAILFPQDGVRILFAWVCLFVAMKVAWDLVKTIIFALMRPDEQGFHLLSVALALVEAAATYEIIKLWLM